MKEGALYELPGGWVWTNLEESFDIVLGQSPPSSSYNLNGSGLPFYQGKSEFSNVYPTPKKWCTAPKKISEKGDVLISVRAPVGPTNICSEKSCIGRGLAAIRPLGGIETFFTLYMMRAFENIIAGKGTGTTFSAITGDKLKKFEVPLPPLPEQRAIVSKIEQLFSDLDNGIDNFKKAQEQLKIYRQAVLKNACEGKLVPTEAELARAEGRDYEPADVLLERILEERRDKWEADLRTKGKDPKKAKYVELQLPNIEGLPSLPKSWMWVSWEWILSYENGAFKRGPFGSALKKSIFVESGYKVYEQYCPINNDCSFGRYYITPEKFDELKNFEVREGDYLVSCSGVTLGRITRVPHEFERGIINQALLRVRINDSIISHLYFLYLFRSPFFQKLLFDNSTGTAIPNVKGVKELKAIPIPLPPLAEQHRIVTEVERRLSVCDKMEDTIAESLEKAESLRQSILKKAFEGKLLNEKELEEARNAPDWEPAEKLLERIKAQKNN